MSCSEVMYQYYPYLYQRPPPPHPHAAPHPSVAHAAAAAAAANPHTAHHSPARPAPFQPFSATTPSHQYDRINVNQRSLESTSLELCGAASVASGPSGGGGGGGTGGSASGGAAAAAAAAAIQAAAVAGVPQGQSSSTGSIGSAPSPASPRPNASQHRPTLSASAQSSRNQIDDDRSTDVGPNTATDDSDDSESRAHYLSANCVVFTHYRGDAASEVEEHFQKALAQDKPKDNNNPMISRNFPASFWKSHHDVYEYADPWHSHYPQYHPRSVHEYHHHHNMANMASYNSLLLNRSLAGHPTSHPGVAHHAHTAATYKDWTAATPTQSLVDASSAPPYPHGPYAPLSSDYWT